MNYLTCPVAELLPGDEWYTDKDTVIIDAVEPTAEPDGIERIRVTGRIVRGWGAGGKAQRWTWPLAQTLEVRRADH